MTKTTQDHVSDVLEKATGSKITKASFHKKSPSKKLITALNHEDPSKFKCLNDAINYFGTPAELARVCDVYSPNVHYWKKNTGLIPASFAYRIHEVSRGTISMVDILKENEIIRLANKTHY